MLTSLPEQQRHSLMLANEGQVLQNAANNNDDVAVDAAKAQIDGVVNGIIRLRGAQSAAEFLFAVTDRAAGGIREETARPLAPAREPLDLGPLKQKRAPWYERLTYSDGLAHGLLLAIMLFAWIRRL